MKECLAGMPGKVPRWLDLQPLFRPVAVETPARVNIPTSFAPVSASRRPSAVSARLLPKCRVGAGNGLISAFNGVPKIGGFGHGKKFSILDCEAIPSWARGCRC